MWLIIRDHFTCRPTTSLNSRIVTENTLKTYLYIISIFSKDIRKIKKFLLNNIYQLLSTIMGKEICKY